MTNTVGFIGAGRMGGAIAIRIASDPAWDVLVFDPSEVALRGLGAQDIGALWDVLGAKPDR